MIRVAVIGVGYWGPNLVANFHNHQQSEVEVVVDHDADRLDQVRQRFPDVEPAQELSAALSNPAVDAVVVATPTSSHYEVAKAALEAGKHVLVEKPITEATETAEELCELADSKGLTLMVGHVFVYNQAAQRVKRYLIDGHLGRIYYISMVRTNLGPIRVDVNSAWDLASHDISLANYWLDAEPVTASAMGSASLSFLFSSPGPAMTTSATSAPASIQLVYRFAASGVSVELAALQQQHPRLQG